MAIVNFAIPITLEKRIGAIVKEKGFASKAEFFRFAAIYFIDFVNQPFVSEDERFNYLTRTLTQEIIRMFRGKKIPSLREQLSGL